MCDVSSLSSIDALVRDWEASGRALHVLVNNAGVLVGGGGSGALLQRHSCMGSCAMRGCRSHSPSLPAMQRETKSDEAGRLR